MGIYKPIKLTVDGYKITMSDSIDLYVGDRVTLQFELYKLAVATRFGAATKTTDIQPLTAILYIETPDGRDVMEAADINDNLVEFNLSEEYTQNIGVSRLQLRLFDDNGDRITLPEFTFNVKESIYGDQVTKINLCLADENRNAVVDEEDNRIATPTRALNVAVNKQIQSFDEKMSPNGNEDMLIQDSGITKRIKVDSLLAQTNARLSKLEDQVNPFTPTLSISKQIAELGSSQNLTLNWSYNRDIKAQKINSDNLDVSVRSKSYSNVSSSTTYTLTATSTLDLTTSKSVSITFVNGIYYGASNSTNYDSDLIKSLTKELSTNKSRTITVNASSGEYIYYCVPIRLGECSFNVNGFEGGFDKAATVSFTNGFNYTENYFIYKSTNSNLGNTTVVVK